MILTIALFLSACKRKDEELDLASSVPPPPPPAAEPEPEKKPEPPKYYYPLSEYRDPFMPLTGGQAYSGKGGAQLAQNFANLELKGILKDRKGKIAVIASTGGESYVLKSGRIFDQRNHLVNGVSGIIKESSVVLIAQNRTTKELSLRKPKIYE